MAISAPVRGGGIMASWRITGWLLRAGEGGLLPNKRGGGWIREDVESLLNYTYTNSTGDLAVVGSMDALVFRIPMGSWLKYKFKAKLEYIKETVEVAHELFVVKAVIFVTVPFDNNTGELWRLEKCNEMIRDFCHSWKPQPGGVQHVLFLDYNKFDHDLIETNALSLGMNVSGDNDDYMMQRMAYKTKFPPSIAHTCAELPSDPNRTAYKRTVITSDGVHPCMETIGARIDAGVSYLLGCAFNHDIINATFVLGCEQDCNRRFMSLSPVDESMFASPSKLT